MTQPPSVPAPRPDGLMSIAIGELGMEVQNAGQLYSVCQVLAQTDMVPEKLRNKPGACFAVAMMGMPLGFDLMTCLRRIEHFAGKPTLPGELLLALLRRQPDLAHFAKGWEGKPYEDDYCAWIETQRKGFPIVRDTFSVREAKEAGLWEKKGPWQTYAKAMLMWRCVGQHMRMEWSDRTNGLQPREEYQDVERGPERARNVTPVRIDLEQEAPSIDPLLLEEIREEAMMQEAIASVELSVGGVAHTGRGPVLEVAGAEVESSSNPEVPEAVVGSAPATEDLGPDKLALEALRQAIRARCEVTGESLIAASRRLMDAAGVDAAFPSIEQCDKMMQLLREESEAHS